MKIMYFLDNFSVLGGAAHTLLRQAELMKKRGAQVKVAYSDINDGKICGGYTRFCERAGLDTVTLSFEISTQPIDFNIVNVIRFYDEVYSAIKEFDPDVLHSVQLNPTVEMVGRELKIPHVMSIYSTDTDFFEENYLDIFPHYHMCDSEFYCDVWKNAWNIKSSCIRTVAEKMICERKPEPSGALKFICVGAVSERKNQLEVIKGFREWKQNTKYNQKDECSLRLYGAVGGAYKEKIQKYISENYLEQSVILEGFCGNLNQIYEEADALLVGSLFESFPNVVSEALANDVTVISTPVAGVPEVIMDGVNGYLTEDYSANSMAASIERYITDRVDGKWKEIRENAENTYEKTHKPSVVSEHLEKYYCGLIEDYKSNCVDRMKMDELREIFAREIADFDSRYDEFSVPKAAEKKIWYLHYNRSRIRNKLAEKPMIYLWGAGKLLESSLDAAHGFFPEMDIQGVIDSKKTGQVCGLPIVSPNEVLKEENKEKLLIFISVLNGAGEIRKFLDGYGLVYNKDYFLLSSKGW